MPSAPNPCSSFVPIMVKWRVMFIWRVINRFLNPKAIYPLILGVRIRAMEPYVTESGSLMQLYATECDELIVYK